MKSINVTVLNLVISGIPSIHFCSFEEMELFLEVLNLVISGIPSIPKQKENVKTL